MVPTAFELVVMALAIARAADCFTRMTGPFSVFVRLRQWRYMPFGCALCMSIWLSLALLAAYQAAPAWAMVFSAALAVSFLGTAFLGVQEMLGSILRQMLATSPLGIQNRVKKPCCGEKNQANPANGAAV